MHLQRAAVALRHVRQLAGQRGQRFEHGAHDGRIQRRQVARQVRGLRQQRVGPDVVDGPDDTVLAVGGDVLGGEAEEGSALTQPEPGIEAEANACLIRDMLEGRSAVPAPLLAGGDLECGTYELVFHIGGYFRAQGWSALGPKLGPILWMLAARRRFDRDDIARFFELLPRTLDGLALRHVIEPRHESFRDEAFFALCREHDVAVVFGDDDEFPCIEADTASFAYARLQRMREEVPTGYDDAALDAFAERARRWQAAERDSYIFMINGAKIRAPAAALALAERLR